MPSAELIHDCFALLDDSDASALLPRSRLYTGYLGTLACQQASALPVMLEKMQQALACGQHAVGLFSYELGEDLQHLAPRPEPHALSQVLLFQHCASLSAEQVSAWLEQRAQQPAGIVNVRANVTQAEFTDAIARIHTYIEAGDTYQVNYTYRLQFDVYGSVFSLYATLRQRQPVPHGALIGLPDGGAVLSLSPELFVRHEQGELTARPMKGTAAATGDQQQDAARAAELAFDPKNRAENLMIVDLLRNDLGRIAEIGSVQVPELFDVSRYASVLQMTSTVHARLRRGTGMADVFDAIYPCGSITGAPKHRSMQIIRELEPAPRGWYTGAIGWFDTPRTPTCAPVQETVGALSEPALGAFCLSVPIRTLVLQALRPDGLRAGEMGVGAGIVHDSKTQEEYEECQLKARFLTGLQHDFELFESIYATRDDGCRNLDRHLQRLRSSAAFFCFVYDEAAIKVTLRNACSSLSSSAPHRLRLALGQAGACTLQAAPLMPLAEPVKLLLSPQAVVVAPLFLHHKTTVRTSYDVAWRTAEEQGAFDMLFCNNEQELTEGGRTNVFIKLAGRWYTPPLAAGVLPGVMRAALLDDPQWQAQQRRLTLDDLRNAEEVVVCNALRGALRAEIVWASA